MTVENIPAEIEYVYTTPGTFFSYPFRVFEETEVKASITLPDGRVRELIKDTDYTVFFNDSKIVVSTSIAPIPQAELRIYREVTPSQETNYVNNDPLNVEILESDFDKCIMLIQELFTKIGNLTLHPSYAGDFVGGKFYNKGDIVKYNNNYYSKINDGVASTPFDVTEWVLYLDVASITSDIYDQLGFESRPSLVDKSFIAKTVAVDTSSPLTPVITLTYDPPVTTGAGTNHYPTPMLLGFVMPSTLTSSSNMQPVVKVNGGTSVSLYSANTSDFIQSGELRENSVYWFVLYTIDAGGGSFIDIAWVLNPQKYNENATNVTVVNQDKFALSFVVELPNNSRAGNKFTFKAPITNEDNVPFSVDIYGSNIEVKSHDNQPLPKRAIRSNVWYTAMFTSATKAVLTDPVDQYYLPRPNRLDNINEVISVSGSPNIITLHMGSIYSSYYDGLQLFFEPTASNTSSATLQLEWSVGGLGNLSPIPIKTLDGNGLVAGELQPGVLANIMVKGNVAYLLNPQYAQTSTATIHADAVWDAVNSRYNVTTGTSMSSIQTGQVFVLTPDVGNTSAVSIKIDNTTSKPLKEKDKLGLHDVLSGMFKEPTMVEYDGTQFVAKLGLSSSDKIPLTLVNSWTNYPAYGTASYIYNPATKVVDVTGLVRSGVIGSVIAALPARFSPTTSTVHASIGTANDIARLDVNSTGDIKHISGGNAYVSLDNIRVTLTDKL